MGFHVRSFVFGVSFDGGFEKTKLQIIDEVVVFFGRAWVGVDNGPMGMKPGKG